MSVDIGKWRERPNSVPWPPLILIASALLAWWLGRLWPIDVAFLRWTGTRVLGGALVGFALALDLAAMLTMRRARANILPHRAATALVTSGPFALSRNPIYLGNTVFLAGLSGALANGWFLAAALGQAVVVSRLAIRREERHLQAQFGAAWDVYSRQTPRWVRLPGFHHREP